MAAQSLNSSNHVSPDEIRNQANSRLEAASKTIDHLSDQAVEYSDRAIAAGKNAVSKSVEFSKEYPVHTALGAGALGFLAGALVSKILK